MNDTWPRRYRYAWRLHCAINRLHRATGQHQATWWLNQRAANLWTGWWINRAQQARR